VLRHGGFLVSEIWENYLKIYLEKERCGANLQCRADADISEI
jgi:hypothetical protein